MTANVPGVETVIDCVVAPFDHEYDGAGLEVSVTEPPAQNVVGPEAVIVRGTGVFTVMRIGAEVAEHPLVFVIVTV